MRRAVVVAGAVVVLLGPAVGVASAGERVAGPRLAAGARAGAGGTWGPAEEVPGIAALNTGGDALVGSVSCASAGNCSAGGFYTESFSHQQAFVVSQASGSWGPAQEVPGTAALNTGGYAAINSVSCASAGNCSAGGFYTGNSGNQEAFVVSQVNGTWGKAKEVPGTAALNTVNAQITSVSCASAGNCSAGGTYLTTVQTPFVVSQVHGTWGKAKRIPGSHGPEGIVNSVSCASAGNCSAGGTYSSRSGQMLAFVISQAHGTWGTAKVVPAPGSGGSGNVLGVSCASAGNCSADGYYYDRSGHREAFVVSQVNGTWGTAKEIPGTAALNQGGSAQPGGLSCGSAGNCTAGGYYFDSSGHSQAFVVSQVNGTWGKAKQVPGIATLGTGLGADITSVSCASAGNCSAGGSYSSSQGGQVFVVSQVGGTWGTAEEVPGTASLNSGGKAAINSVSCASAGNCSAGGFLNDGGNLQAFVVSQT
jgi:hypothetical protein